MTTSVPPSLPANILQENLDIPSSSGTSQKPKLTRQEALELVEEILTESNLYRILGVSSSANTEEIRRAYISRSRVCHPDKLPGNSKATEAFQKISTAYETLSNTNSRKTYDNYGTKINSLDSEETLSSALLHIFNEFMEGDFEHLLSIVGKYSAEFINFQNPDLNIDKEKANQLFVQVREVFLVAGKYLSEVKFEVMKLYEIQGELRSLSYFDVFGRLRLSIQLSRVFFSIPVKMNNAVAERQIVNSQLCRLLSELTGLLEFSERTVGRVDAWVANRWRTLPLNS
ncbi:DnaJ-domain-containing protein [Basidiobolus meristosporus CBS 931.73]|uniref:DnaJ-domain-containing protein n=1 Tax=Basidiobolus meristosporus CBS 931.73 TaxID=1314790 RepID=A0A1Y1Y4Y3_9FUNG|nr:DnaJ-domain-containing protein [Basidiobolus meristosporus CBS 931.73]|eukprot:ORX92955.1 DnaJ-domain-containing protein [Basidiobolus meristosporus CBS 931.73]